MASTFKQRNKKPTINQYLKLLEKNGIIISQKSFTDSFYSLLSILPCDVLYDVHVSVESSSLPYAFKQKVYRILCSKCFHEYMVCDDEEEKESKKEERIVDISEISF
ncbi:MAG: hypothetical protein QW575_06880 [Thermoproteota archaeon]